MPQPDRPLPVARAAQLAQQLGLSDEELLIVLDADPLSVLSGGLDDALEVTILLALTAEAAERAGDGVLRRWLRASTRHGAPLDMLLRRDFSAFEDALAELAERGFVISRRER